MPDMPQDIKDMQKRISEMKAKAQVGQNKEENYSQLAIAFQILIEIVSGVFVGMGIGYILDEMFDLRFVCLLIFTIFGGMAGLLNTFRYLKKNEDNRKGM